MKKTMAAIFIGFIFSSCYISFFSPQNDWDMLAYSAIYYQSQGWNEENIHQHIYDTLLITMPKETQRLLHKRSNEIACAVNTNFFFQQIPFYTIKPGYNLLIRMITFFTKDPIESMIWISVCSYFFICMIVWLWLQARMDVIWATVASICIASLPALIEQSRIFTPDAPATFLILSAMYLLFVKQNKFWSMLLIAISISVRPDNVLFAILMGGYLFYQQYYKHNKIDFISVAAIILSLYIYFFIEWFYHGEGWKVTFQHSIINLDLAPVVWHKIDLTMSDYFKYLFRGMWNFKIREFFLLFLLSYFSIRISKQSNEIKMLQYILAAIMVIKFFAFPLFDDRYYMVQYIFAMMMICIAMFPNKEMAD